MTFLSDSQVAGVVSALVEANGGSVSADFDALERALQVIGDAEGLAFTVERFVGGRVVDGHPFRYAVTWEPCDGNGAAARSNS
jgi:hypothetical protein